MLELGVPGPCSGVVLNFSELPSLKPPTSTGQLLYLSIVCCDDLAHYLSATAAVIASHI